MATVSGTHKKKKEKVESRKGSVVEKVLTGEGVRKRPRRQPRKRWRDPY